MSIATNANLKKSYIEQSFEGTIDNTVTEFTTSTNKSVLLKGRKALADLDVYIASVQYTEGLDSEEIQMADGNYVTLTLAELQEVKLSAALYGGDLARKRKDKMKEVDAAANATYTGTAQEVEAQAINAINAITW